MTTTRQKSSSGGQQHFTIDLLPSRSENLGIITLNRPAALNALSLDMIRSLNHILPQFRSDETLHATLFEGCHTGKRSVFCSGGDVKSVYMSGKGLSNTEDSVPSDQHGYGAPSLETADFFREEYQMNHLIATQPERCPQISIWDGVVMGGGAGISVHGKYRVATENTLFAMPETGIGLFPDVGSMYWLPRLEGGLGTYIALTGARLKADDLMYAGLATHYVPSSKLMELRDALVAATAIASSGDNEGNDTDVNDNVHVHVGGIEGVLASFAEDIDTTNSLLATNRGFIDKSFSFEKKSSVEEIVESLHLLSSSSSSSDACDSTEFSRKTLDTIHKMSPTSLKVTFEGIRRGAELLDVASVLKMEYRMVQGFMRENSDFYEGIRAVLVDKDHKPKWSPGKLAEVTDDVVASFFESLGDNELVFPEDTNDYAASKL
eukprot:CAMPEP_0116036692 /NCGR_PEP_ID=MMETSP0321-20121206/21408_1 /TAXON_ID=163516 /ORGANISM="Leptocylindrus danicus var. danicus, Strain B650" /LENGTH=434 /DNA_ID=CAMNT_0003514351 /DNA_START=2066 /DNA_END=3370 /DNA_ORIENTATION=+